MPWKEQRAAQVRREFIKRVLNGEKTKAELCREYGISRPTGDKWIKRYLSGKELEDRSRRPNRIARKTPSEIEQLIVEYRKAHPAIGAVKIRRILSNKGYTDLPCEKTVNNILKRNALINKEASRAATPNIRFEKAYPNEMWQADYKGHFPMMDGQRCHPLNIIDDYSRYNLCCKPQLTETYEEIKPVMIALFETYGMPFSLLCDNGNPWGTAQSTGFTQFEVWMMDMGILTMHGNALHPQTQGKEERFNQSMTKELLRHTQIEDMEDAERKFGAYREFYNNERPHRALDLDTPAQHYKRSTREYDPKIKAWEYPEGCTLHRVKSTGYISVDGQGYFLSGAFGEKEIALKKSDKPDCVDLLYRQFIIGRIDKERRVFTFKRAYLQKDDPRFRGE